MTHREPLQTGFESAGESDHTFYGASHFQHMLSIERKRTERSKRPFLLLLLDISDLTTKENRKTILEKIRSALSSSLREVDIRGWYNHNNVIGILFTEMTTIDVNSIERIIHKVYGRFSQCLDTEWVNKIRLSFHVFPETDGDVSIKEPFNINLYPDIAKRDGAQRMSRVVKDVFDRVASALALLLFSPLFLIIAVAIKATSDGPVFFRQTRMGLNGETFSFLKFRSMHTHCDPVRHQKYIAKYIGKKKDAAVEPGVFKLKDDNRITPVGRFLRKTSLDELPQFINVFKGDMSLVGPRPPIPYECDLYDIWHRRRLLSCKPGITGLWQVTGRSRTTFDQMVRLDLKYISEWSLWLDFKILLMTPGAVLSGKGAY
jgi:lipopolysaccharide/colanic/teichoic acid biosynthesis glycosyltransferase